MKKMVKWLLNFCLVGFIVMNFYSCGTINQERAISAGTTALQSLAVTDDMIKGYVKEFIDQSDKTNKVCGPTDAYYKRIQKIAGNFNNKDGINIKVYKTNSVNAFACADGSVRIYTGLMDIMTDAEILGVIGHEIGHVMEKHTKNAYKKAILVAALKEGIAATGGTAASIADSQIGALGAAVVNAKYSQKQEYEADDYGYEFLKKYGVNPVAMAQSFKKLQQLEGGSSSASGALSGLQQLLSTHPQLDKRIKRMEDRAIAEGYAK